MATLNQKNSTHHHDKDTATTHIKSHNENELFINKSDNNKDCDNIDTADIDNNDHNNNDDDANDNCDTVNTSSDGFDGIYYIKKITSVFFLFFENCHFIFYTNQNRFWIAVMRFTLGFDIT